MIVIKGWKEKNDQLFNDNKLLVDEKQTLIINYDKEITEL